MLDTIVDNSLDLFAVVETWHDSAEATSVVAATPPSYLVFERTRPMSAAKAASLATHQPCRHLRLHPLRRPGQCAGFTDIQVVRAAAAERATWYAVVRTGGHLPTRPRVSAVRQ